MKVTELSQLLQVSVDTVRRDLKKYGQEGWIKYVRGGACLPEDQKLLPTSPAGRSSTAS
ncbi:MAG: DeoR family transcriptional regulator [Flavonifractor plautii]